jgi:hypothetical protein
MGPCMCGDPYCSSCGDPGRAEAEEAETAVIELFAKEKFTPEEYRLASVVAIAAVMAHREAIKGYQRIPEPDYGTDEQF